MLIVMVIYFIGGGGYGEELRGRGGLYNIDAMVILTTEK